MEQDNRNHILNDINQIETKLKELEKTLLKENLSLLKDEIIDTTILSKKALIKK